MNLEAMFPSGRWNADKTAFLVRKGRYDWHAAEVKDGSLILTDFGRRMAVTMPQRPIIKVPSGKTKRK